MSTQTREAPVGDNLEKTERINCRISSYHKGLIEQAAAFSGQSMSEFIVRGSIENAQKAIRNHQNTVLSDTDRDLFLNILDEEEPNDALEKAAEAYSANFR